MVAGPRRARPLGRPHGRAHREGAAPRASWRRRVEGHGRPPSFRCLLEQGPRRRAHGHQSRRCGCDGLDGLRRDDGHAFRRARDGAAAAGRPHYCTCAHVRVFEIPSLTSFARGPITRVALAPRINGPATEKTIGPSFVNGALIAAGRWFITLGHFPGGSRAFGQDWACARFLGVRSAGGPAGGSWRPARLGCQPASRAAAKIG